MDTSIIIAIIGAVTSIVVAALSGFISYKATRKKASDDLKAIREQENLSIQKEALLFEYKARYEQIQKIVATFTPLFNDIYALFPTGLEYSSRDKEEQERIDGEKYDRARDSYNNALSTLKSCAPFLTIDLYEEGLGILKKCLLQINAFPYVKKSPDGTGYGHDKDCYEATNEIREAIDKWNEHIRTDLDSRQLLVSGKEG